MKRALTTLLLACLPMIAAAEVYRWVDEHGQVHYSQTPPKQPGYGTVAPPPPASAAPNQETLLKALDEGRQQEAERNAQQAKAAQEQAQRQQRCRQAREQLAYLREHPPFRLLKTDDKGEVSRVTEAEYLQRQAEFQKVERENCN
jgi:hypothetical protein